MILAVEVGGSSVQAVQFDDSGIAAIVPLATHSDEPWLLTAPGLVEGNRVRGAHHLGWMDIQASQELAMSTPPLLSMNDAEAAAIGEWWLHEKPSGTLLYISLGTGVGAVAITDGTLNHVEFGHLTWFGPQRCGGCGRVGCLDAQIGGHALPTPLGEADMDAITTALAAALSQQPIAIDRVVVGGGIAKKYPELIARLQKHTALTVMPSACPPQLKSAALFGLYYSYRSV